MANTVKQAFNALTPEQQEIVRARKFAGKRSPGRVDRAARAGRRVTTATPTRCARAAAASSRAAGRRSTTSRTRCARSPTRCSPILREDQDPEVPLELWVDLTGPLQSGKAVRNTPAYKKGAYRKVVDTLLRRHVVPGPHALRRRRARPLRGHRPRALHVQRARSNPRGKIKRKTKNKKKTELTVTLTVPNRNYARPGGRRPRRPEAEAQARRQPHEGHARRHARRRPRSDVVPALESMIELISGAYERVAPARRKKL